jgi:hypothetical protein
MLAGAHCDSEGEALMNKVYKLMQREYVRYSRIWRWSRS